MTAIRKFIKVKNHTINIKVQKEFENQEVEVIILQKDKIENDIEWDYWSDEEDYSKW